MLGRRNGSSTPCGGVATGSLVTPCLLAACPFTLLAAQLTWRRCLALSGNKVRCGHVHAHQRNTSMTRSLRRRYVCTYRLLCPGYPCDPPVWPSAQAPSTLPAGVNLIYPSPGYLRGCYKAHEMAGHGMLESFVNTTLLLDRQTTLKEYLDANPALAAFVRSDAWYAGDRSWRERPQVASHGKSAK